MYSKIAERSSARVTHPAFGASCSRRSLVSVANLSDGVVITGPDGAHRLRDPGVVGGLAQGQADVLPAMVGVVDRSRRRPARRDGHLQRVDDELLAHVGLHRPPDDPAAEQILHGAQIQPALSGLDLLDVRSPYAIRGVGAKVTADEVTERLDAIHAHRAALATALERTLKARSAHQPLDAHATDPDALTRQHRVHARAAIAPAARRVDTADALGQPRVGHLTI